MIIIPLKITCLTTGRGQSNTDRKTTKQWAGSSHRSATYMLFIICGVSIHHLRDIDLAVWEIGKGKPQSKEMAAKRALNQSSCLKYMYLIGDGSLGEGDNAVEVETQRLFSPTGSYVAGLVCFYNLSIILSS